MCMYPEDRRGFRSEALGDIYLSCGQLRSEATFYGEGVRTRR